MRTILRAYAVDGIVPEDLLLILDQTDLGSCIRNQHEKAKEAATKKAELARKRQVWLDLGVDFPRMAGIIRTEVTMRRFDE